MRSFLEDVNDNGLTWEDDSDDSQSSSSSLTSESSEEANDPNEVDESDEEVEDAGVEHDVPEVAVADDEHAEEVEPNHDIQPAPIDPSVAHTDNVTTVMDNLRRHPRSDHILFRVARSEELALVRPDINWESVTRELNTYPGLEVGDRRGSVLLQGILRMDPPIDVARELFKVYPKSCVNMDSFFVACQHASDDVVQLVMHETLKARRLEGIKWGMLAFLGDARIRRHHARFLLQFIPESVTDPGHGVFGVSPLDRMLSGAFIHGHPAQWISKVKLALLTAEFGSVDATEDTDGSFCPFHALVRRIISPDFMGVHFGQFTFIHTLEACLRAERRPFHEVDKSGCLPLHAVLSSECRTNIGVLGERKLVKFLLRHNSQSAMVPNAAGCLPLRMCIENGWPCYDILVDACPEALRNRDCHGDLCIHAALKGPYHSRYGISGARRIVNFLLSKNPLAARTHSGKGRLPLHLALENGWPCHDILLAAAPQALETRDVTTGFYPFQIAAYSFKDEEDELSLKNLSLVYEMIREGPLLTYGLVSGSTRPNETKPDDHGETVRRQANVAGGESDEHSNSEHGETVLIGKRKR